MVGKIGKGTIERIGLLILLEKKVQWNNLSIKLLKTIFKVLYPPFHMINDSKVSANFEKVYEFTIFF